MIVVIALKFELQATKSTMVLPYCSNTAPILTPNASISMMKVSLKLGSVRIGAVVNSCFNCSKLWFACIVYVKVTFLSKSERGATMVAYHLMNFL